MALTLPDEEDLSLFSHGATDVFDADQAEQAIEQAGSLLFLATRVSEDPILEEERKIVRWGILDMAWSLLIKTENKTEIFSPYGSEHIGSYSYTKASYAVRRGETTNVEWFEAAKQLLLAETGAQAMWGVTEAVFDQPYDPGLHVTTFFPDYYGR